MWTTDKADELQFLRLLSSGLA